MLLTLEPSYICLQKGHTLNRKDREAGGHEG